MFLIRAFVVLLVAFVSITRCDGAGGGSKNDRMDDLFSLMYNIGKRVDSLSDSVKDIYRMEEETAEHMLKTEDRVSEIVTQMGQMKTQIGEVDGKVNMVTSWFNWKFIGHGYQGSLSHQIFYSYGTTLQQCISFCAKKRQESGAAWNGLDWTPSTGQCNCNENDVGHTENSAYLHFRIQ